MNPPLVSVIIPFLDAERFLEEAIESVMAQTYASWELILVDDGSTDRSTDIARHYAGRYRGQVHYVEHEDHQNRGLCASRNFGIRNSKGAYLAFLDADDVWLPHKLARQTAIAESEPRAAMVCGNSEYWFSWTGKREELKRDRVNQLRVVPGLAVPPSLLISSLRGRSITAHPSNILLRREAFDRAGGFEEAFIGARMAYEDQAFLAKIHLCEYVFVADECWDRYRKHPASVVAGVKRTGHGVAVRLFYLTWLESYLAAQPGVSRDVWAALRTALWPYRHPTLASLHERARRFLKFTTAMAARSGRRVLPAPIRRRARDAWHGRPYCPPPGWVHFGSLRRMSPIGRHFGKERGQPIDRYYIERFLATHAGEISGRVLEIGDDRYTRQFGGERVTTSDVLHVQADHPHATIVADLARADHMPSDAFDAIIVTQTLPFIYDVRAAITTLHRVLKPGGVVLATFAGISQISRWDMDRWGHYWHFTTLSAKRLFAEVFTAEAVRVEALGNVLAATALLQGLAAEELRPAEIEHHDPDYEVLITVRAVKA